MRHQTPLLFLTTKETNVATVVVHAYIRFMHNELILTQANMKQYESDEEKVRSAVRKEELTLLHSAMTNTLG